MNATPTPKAQANSTTSDLTETVGAAHDWFMEFIKTRQDVFIPCLVVIGIALVAHIIVGWTLRRYSRRMSQDGFQWTGVIASSLTAPAGLAIWVLAATMVARMLIVPDPTKTEAAILSTRIAEVRLGMVLLLLAWFLVRTVRRIETKLSDRAKTSDRLDLTAVHAVANFMVVFIWLMTIMIAAQSYGMNMSAVLTLGGASAFALSFAFQDVFKNLFGGIMILFSRPFRVGDSVSLSSKSLAGTIERIGIYQTRMRDWDNIPVIIPNSMFLTDPIMNLSGTSMRRVKFVVGLRYQDFDQVMPIVGEIESALRSHEDVDEEALLRVVFSNYGDSTLDITITCNSHPGASVGEGAALRQKLMLLVGEIVSRHGADFAFPTQTLDIPTPVQVTGSSSS